MGGESGSVLGYTNATRANGALWLVSGAGEPCTVGGRFTDGEPLFHRSRVPLAQVKARHSVRFLTGFSLRDEAVPSRREESHHSSGAWATRTPNLQTGGLPTPRSESCSSRKSTGQVSLMFSVATFKQCQRAQLDCHWDVFLDGPSCASHSFDNGGPRNQPDLKLALQKRCAARKSRFKEESRTFCRQSSGRSVAWDVVCPGTDTVRVAKSKQRFGSKAKRGVAQVLDGTLRLALVGSWFVLCPGTLLETWVSPCMCSPTCLKRGTFSLASGVTRGFAAFLSLCSFGQFPLHSKSSPESDRCSSSDSRVDARRSEVSCRVCMCNVAWIIMYVLKLEMSSRRRTLL